MLLFQTGTVELCHLARASVRPHHLPTTEPPLPRAAHAVQVYLSKPQEVYQWEEFAACVARVRSGGAPDERWARLAALTNAVVVAVAESARQGCRELPFEFKF